MNVSKFAISGVLSVTAVAISISLSTSPTAPDAARDTIPVAQTGDPLPTPIPDAVKQAPAPGEVDNGDTYTLDEARAQVAAERHSAVCVAPDGTFTVVMYAPVLDAAGVPIKLPVDFVPSAALEGMPANTTCQTHDQLNAG